MNRTLTPREMLRFQICEQLLGCDQLTPDLRMAQVQAALKLRNAWTTATRQADTAGLTAGLKIFARTPAFSEALVVTDLISLLEVSLETTSAILLLEVFEYGGQERSSGLDYFGLSGPVPQRYILKHEKNRSVAVIDRDLQGRYISSIPRLLAPYQQLEFVWTTAQAPFVNIIHLQSGVRGVRTLMADNPYSYLTTRAEQDVRSYIRGSRPETFFLEALLPFARFPAVGAAVEFKTPQMERPLLVLGATSNVEGVQAGLRDESKHYTFTTADVPLNQHPGVPLYDAPPLALWANNAGFRNANLYNMWPVPHFLDRGSQFVIKLTNGLTPNAAGVYQDTMLTRSEQDARITFICRTV